LPAAGRGQRFGKPGNKVFEILGSKPIIAYSLQVFQDLQEIDEIVLVTGKNDVETADNIVRRFGFSKVSAIVVGGNERQDSVRIGLEHISGEIVAIHDAARPLIDGESIRRSIEAAREHGAAIVAVPVIDTIKSSGEGFVTGTEDRSRLVSVQTPQTFRTDLIRKAHDRALSESFYSTDDSALVEWIGEKVAIVDGSYDNIKITTPSDMRVVLTRLDLVETRTGIGYDVHRLVEGRELVLGGVHIEHEKGLLGHSDADVLLHALSDALLGAAGLGDIGRHFPDTDMSYKGISSLKLLDRVRDLLVSDSWELVNTDIVLVCQKPKIAGFVDEMISNIAKVLRTETSRINIKGTTTEGLGFTGREEGIACYATVSIKKAE
jgi:2-C-methyl-D-erythritol 4-phosphate cytidylyltransferase / 2-C-methyl-D-erythritol 2,4-cyclodiphosphate synthase